MRGFLNIWAWAVGITALVVTVDNAWNGKDTPIAETAVVAGSIFAVLAALAVWDSRNNRINLI